MINIKIGFNNMMINGQTRMNMIILDRNMINRWLKI
jgi:hypothetical protein